MVYAERRVLVEGRESLFRLFAAPAVFLLSIPIAFASPAAAEYSWLLLLVVGRIQRRQEAHG